MKDIATGHGFDATVHLGENFAGRINYNLQKQEDLDLWNDKFTFISAFFPFKETDEQHKPYQAYASVGNDILNLIVGRDRTEAGIGKTGNIAFGDNLYYQNFAKFSAVTHPFSYDLTVYEFDNQLDSNMSLSPICHDMPFQVLVSHRFSMAFSKFLSLSVYESVLTYGDTYAVINAINPFMVLHNTYAFSHSSNNNFCGGELNFSIKNYEISLGVMLDQFQFEFEIDNIGGAGEIAPNSYAAQLNIKGSWSLNKGILDAYAEAVYTSPVCYLKEVRGKYKDGPFWYNQDLIVGTCFSSPDESEYIGYKYGPDTIAAGLGVSYRANKWSVRSDFTFLAQGSYGKRHDYIIFGNSTSQAETLTEEERSRIQYTFDMTEEESLKYLNALSPYVFNGESVEYTTMATIKASYKFSDFVTLNGGFGYIHVTNYCNDANQKLDDCQFSLSATIDVVPVAKRLLNRIK